jgi:hypothetical protein
MIEPSEPTLAPSPTVPRLFTDRLDDRLDKLRGERRDNCVVVGVQSSHSIGNPISQRENAGSSWPRFSIDTFDPFDFAPESGIADSAQSASVRHLEYA